MSKSARLHAEQRGRRGETLAAWYLRLTGWRILARRQKIGLGEVDLIARRGRTVAFIEVKWRATAEALDLAIDARRLARVARAPPKHWHRALPAMAMCSGSTCCCLRRAAGRATCATSGNRKV